MRDLDLAAKLSLLNMLAKISLAVTEFVPPDFSRHVWARAISLAGGL
jgi:hypothetical protein